MGNARLLICSAVGLFQFIPYFVSRSFGSTLAACAAALVLSLGAMGSTLAAATAPAGGADVTYTLPTATKISLSIVNSNGWIVRELLRADAENAGSHTAHWDGNDDMGRPCPPGDYTWRAVYGDRIKADYVLSLGNSGQPPLPHRRQQGKLGRLPR